MEAMDGEAAGPVRFDQRHALARADEGVLEAPAEAEGVLRSQVVDVALPSVDVDLVVALHDEVEAPEEGLVGDDAVLSAEEMPGALQLEEGHAGVLLQLEGAAVVGRVEPAELLVPLGEGLPLHEGVVPQVSIGVVPEDDLRPGREGHGQVRVVAPRRAFDELRREVLGRAVAAVAEEVGQRAVHGGLLGLVEPDLEHHAPGRQFPGVVAGEVDGADDPRSDEIGHGHPLPRVQGGEVLVPIVRPARVLEAHGRSAANRRELEPCVAIRRRRCGAPCDQDADRQQQVDGWIDHALVRFESRFDPRSEKTSLSTIAPAGQRHDAGSPRLAGAT